jgi:hypothetical protein
MGRFFPDYRPGTPDQVRAYRDAEEGRYRNERYEGKARIRTETPRSDRLTDRVDEAVRPLSRIQQWWHRQRAASRVDRDFARLQRASNRQDRQRRRVGRSRPAVPSARPGRSTAAPSPHAPQAPRQRRAPASPAPPARPARIRRSRARTRPGRSR